ncbi:hypothetical protein [Roseiconus lacunae]|uniref:hypothetical protein n=1 Tax=Roseiconus lacunae TaxID=2605694 RepID=UPI001E317162|nr:hypothetical protein [Roseiconus lacunae]MCD0459942.1 hypothetical protein [Roseiconus lacunae]
MTTELQNRITDLIDKGTEEYFAWLRQILTISSGSLTLLIALRTKFVPAEPRCLLLLQIAWVLLAMTVLASLLALGGYQKLFLRSASILKNMQETGIRYNSYLVVPQPYRFFGTLAPYAFAASLTCLCIFGVTNLSGPETAEYQTMDTAPNGNDANAIILAPTKRADQ